MATKKDICTVDKVESLMGDDNVLVNVDGSLGQISMADLVKSADPVRIESLEVLEADTNPAEVWIEVIDAEGKPKKIRYSVLPAASESEVAYGVERASWLLESTELTRVGNMELHRTLPVQSLMRGCLLDDNGKVLQYMPDRSWEGVDRSGASGQVMVEIPGFYYKVKRVGVLRQLWMSLYPIEGYTYSPKMYVSAYQASLDRTNLLLSSVVNMTEQFRGGTNKGEYDDTDHSLLGCAATGISRTNFRSYARKRKAGSTEWNIMTYDMQRVLYMMFVVEYATLNPQKDVNTALTAEGYRQGGLGAGVSNLKDYASWTAWNGNNPFIKNGYTDSLGNGSGEIPYTMPDSYTEAAGATLVVKVNRYRGVEMPFGHIYIFCDGYNIMVSAELENGGEGTSMAYVCSDPAKFSDTGNEGYRYVGNVPRASGYVTAIACGDFYDIVPIVSTEIAKTGGTSVYYCDYFSTTLPTSGTELRAPLLGGHASYGSYCGFVSVASYLAPSNTNANFGSRLCFIPKHAA